MNAEDYISQVKALDSMIENSLADSEHWWSIANNTTSNMSGETFDSSHDPHKKEAAICKYLDLKAEADALIAKRDGIIETIKKLNSIEYDILHKLYVQYNWTLKKIASKYDRRYEWASQKHRLALKHLQKLIDEQTKTP